MPTFFISSSWIIFKFIIIACFLRTKELLGSVVVDSIRRQQLNFLYSKFLIAELEVHKATGGSKSGPCSNHGHRKWRSQKTDCFRCRCHPSALRRHCCPSMDCFPSADKLALPKWWLLYFRSIIRGNGARKNWATLSQKWLFCFRVLFVLPSKHFYRSFEPKSWLEGKTIYWKIVCPSIKNSFLIMNLNICKYQNIYKIHIAQIATGMIFSKVV